MSILETTDFILKINTMIWLLLALWVFTVSNALLLEKDLMINFNKQTLQFITFTLHVTIKILRAILKLVKVEAKFNCQEIYHATTVLE
jgi:hypothetical protein